VERVAAVRERLPEAMYESRSKTLSIRVFEEPDDEGSPRLAAASALAEALAATAPERVAQPV
jgi:hypothetical protein